jgi:ribosomal protein L11 methylase PrmA
MPPDWARWPTVEGGYLIDRRAVAEAWRPRGAGEGEESWLRAALIALLDADVERCRHALPIGVDLALPDGGASLGLNILAGPAMGSGRRPWTKTMLAALERHLERGMRVADVGTGTGILGLVALSRGAAEVDAVDTDPLALAVARRNARRNDLPLRLVPSLDGRYDLALVSLGGLDETAAALPGVETHADLLVAGPAEGDAEKGRLEALFPSKIETIEVDGWHAVVARVSSRP